MTLGKTSSLGKTGNSFYLLYCAFDLDRLMAYSFMRDDFGFNQNLNQRHARMDEWLMREISLKQIYTSVATL